MVSQDKFFGNKNNKRFISMLMSKLKDANFTVKQAPENADTDRQYGH